jgi:hypothetical protein
MVARSENAKYQPDGPVDLSSLYGIEAASEVAKAGRVNRTHLVDQHASSRSVHLDLRPEDRWLGTGGGRGDD